MCGVRNNDGLNGQIGTGILPRHQFERSIIHSYANHSVTAAKLYSFVKVFGTVVNGCNDPDIDRPPYGYVLCFYRFA